SAGRGGVARAGVRRPGVRRRRSGAGRRRGGRVGRRDAYGGGVRALLREALRPALDRLVLLLLLDALLDRVLERLERRRGLGLDVGLGEDDVPAELRLHGLRVLAGLELERDLVERRDGRALRDGQVAAELLRAGIGRVLLGEVREVAAGVG